MIKNSNFLRFLFSILFVFTLFSCGVSTESLAKSVQESLVKHYKEKNIEIVFSENLILTHKSGNEYTTFADVTLNGVKTRIHIDVLFDGKSYQMEWRETKL